MATGGFGQWMGWETPVSDEEFNKRLETAKKEKSIRGLIELEIENKQAAETRQRQIQAQQAAHEMSIASSGIGRGGGLSGIGGVPPGGFGSWTDFINAANPQGIRGIYGGGKSGLEDMGAKKISSAREYLNLQQQQGFQRELEDSIARQAASAQGPEPDMTQDIQQQSEEAYRRDQEERIKRMGGFQNMSNTPIGRF